MLFNTRFVNKLKWNFHHFVHDDSYFKSNAEFFFSGQAQYEWMLRWILYKTVRIFMVFWFSNWNVPYYESRIWFDFQFTQLEYVIWFWLCAIVSMCRKEVLVLVMPHYNNVYGIKCMTTFNRHSFWWEKS